MYVHSNNNNEKKYLQLTHTIFTCAFVEERKKEVC